MVGLQQIDVPDKEDLVRLLRKLKETVVKQIVLFDIVMTHRRPIAYLCPVAVTQVPTVRVFGNDHVELGWLNKKFLKLSERPHHQIVAILRFGHDILLLVESKMLLQRRPAIPGTVQKAYPEVPL